MSRTRILIVDDSALMRAVLSGIIGQAPDLEVVGTATDPVRARELIESLRPDVITLDVEMPRMDGLTFLERLMAERPMPVVMVSSLTEKGSELAMRAFQLGAVEVVEKPKLDLMAGTMDMAPEILQKIRAAALARVRRPGDAPARPEPAPARPEPAPGPASGLAPAPMPAPRTGTVRVADRIIAVGASTGGTEALDALLRKIPARAPPILIVQHMPAAFTRSFARRLNALGGVGVTEAKSGDPVLPGHALLAPGDQHMRLVRAGGKYIVQVTGDAQVNLHRPSVDVLFDSCARTAGAAAIGVILTGMGADGANGLLAMRQAGSMTFAQDESTSVVFGMPREAIARGAACEVHPLERMAAAVMRAAS